MTGMICFGSAAEERDEDDDDEQDRHDNLGQQQTDEVKYHQANHQDRHQGDHQEFDWVHVPTVRPAAGIGNGVGTPCVWRLLGDGRRPAPISCCGGRGKVLLCAP